MLVLQHGSAEKVLRSIGDVTLHAGEAGCTQYKQQSLRNFAIHMGPELTLQVAVHVLMQHRDVFDQANACRYYVQFSAGVCCHHVSTAWLSFTPTAGDSASAAGDS